MVLVEPRMYHNIKTQNNIIRRHSYSGSSSQSEMLPAIDFPLQFNFGSPYSSSLTIFFDFEQKIAKAAGKKEK